LRILEGGTRASSRLAQRGTRTSAPLAHRGEETHGVILEGTIMVPYSQELIERMQEFHSRRNTTLSAPDSCAPVDVMDSRRD